MQKESLQSTVPEACEAPNLLDRRENALGQLKYLFTGMVFGVVFIKAEIVSWYRIQEMFLFDSFHMYGIIGSAVVTGMVSVYLIKKLDIKTVYGERPKLQHKTFNKGQIYGGIIFGIGWALTGACPGPLYAQLGAGYWAIGISILSAIAGVWLYGRFRDKLPH
jgi:uncharacterized membrane protein YedE/YeeE